MEDKFEQLISDDAKSVRLDEAEKSLIREHLVSYMKMHPLREPIAGLTPKSNISIFFSLIAGSSYRAPVAFGMAALLIISGGSLSYIALGSFPGETLYSLKVAVVERIPSIFSTSSLARAKWETTLAERRLEEAEALAASGLLDEKTAGELVAHFQTHRTRVERWAGKAEADQVALVEEANTMLIRMQSLSSAEGLAALKIQVAKADADIKFAAEGTYELAKGKIEKVSQASTSINDPAVLKVIQANYRAATRAFGAGEVKLKAGDYRGAYIAFHEAVQILKSTEVMLAK